MLGWGEPLLHLFVLCMVWHSACVCVCGGGGGWGVCTYVCVHIYYLHTILLSCPKSGYCPISTYLHIFDA